MIIRIILGIICGLWILTAGRQWKDTTPRDNYSCGLAVGFTTASVFFIILTIL